MRDFSVKTISVLLVLVLLAGFAPFEFSAAADGYSVSDLSGFGTPEIVGEKEVYTVSDREYVISAPITLGENVHVEIRTAEGADVEFSHGQYAGEMFRVPSSSSLEITGSDGHPLVLRNAFTFAALAVQSNAEEQTAEAEGEEGSAEAVPEEALSPELLNIPENLRGIVSAGPLTLSYVSFQGFISGEGYDGAAVMLENGTAESSQFSEVSFTDCGDSLNHALFVASGRNLAIKNVSFTSQSGLCGMSNEGNITVSWGNLASYDGFVTGNGSLGYEPEPIQEETPVLEETPVEEIVTPEQQETPVEEIVTPAQEETPVEEIVTPEQQETPVEEIVTPAQEETPVQEIVTPAQEETPVQEIVTPVQEETPVQEIVTPAQEETSAQEIVTPVQQEIPVEEIVTPVQETKEQVQQIETPWKEETVTSFEEKPVAPVEEKPVAPVEEKPVVPVEEKPVAPVEEEPVVPVEEKTVDPVEEKPVVPVEEKPVTPAEVPSVAEPIIDVPQTSQQKQTVSINVDVSWADSNSGVSSRPESVTVRLKKNGAEFITETLSAANNWHVSFAVDDLTAKYDVIQDDLKNFETSYKQSGTDVFITNTPKKSLVDFFSQILTPEKTETENAAAQTQTVPTEQNAQTQQTAPENQPVSAEGQQVEHQVTSSDTSGTQTEQQTQAAVQPTPQSYVDNSPKQLINVSAAWSDNNNSANRRPGKLQVNLYLDNALYTNATLSAENNWSCSFTNLTPGRSYRVEQSGAPDYVTTYQTSGTTVYITNRYTGSQPTSSVHQQTPGTQQTQVVQGYNNPLNDPANQASAAPSPTATPLPANGKVQNVVATPVPAFPLSATSTASPESTSAPVITIDAPAENEETGRSSGWIWIVLLGLSAAAAAVVLVLLNKAKKEREAQEAARERARRRAAEAEKRARAEVSEGVRRTQNAERQERSSVYQDYQQRIEKRQSSDRPGSAAQTEYHTRMEKREPGTSAAAKTGSRGMPASGDRTRSTAQQSASHGERAQRTADRRNADEYRPRH